MHYPGCFFTVYQAMQPKALFALFNFPQLPLTGPFLGISALKGFWSFRLYLLCYIFGLKGNSEGRKQRQTRKALYLNAFYSAFSKKCVKGAVRPIMKIVFSDNILLCTFKPGTPIYLCNKCSWLFFKGVI